MAQMPVVEEGAEPPPYFPRTLVTRSDGHDQCRGGLVYTMSAPRGNAAKDAPRPHLNVAPMRGQAPALLTSCARLTESAICAICDAERHGRHARAERWA